MFRKRKAINPDGFTDRAAAKIASAITWMQKKFADTLNKQTRNYSKLTWKLLIGCFVVAWAVVSVRSITSAFAEHAVRSPNTTTHFVTRPAYTDSLVLMEHIYEQRKKNKNE